MKIWLEEYIKSVAYSKFLLEQDTTTSVRQAFILLENAFEQYMNEIVNLDLADEERINYRKFHVLLEKFSMSIEINPDDYKKIESYHKVYCIRKDISIIWM